MRWIFLTLLLLNALFAMLELSAVIGGHKDDVKGYQVVQGGERLLLLTELSESPAGSIKLTGEGVGRLCLLAGPINTKEGAGRVLEALGRFNISADVIAQSITKAPNYWVYLQPYESRKAAIAKLKKLQAAKVDSYLITQGELANGISLGVFENIDSARRMLERRQGQGYEVKIKELGKKDFEYWVSVHEGYSAELDEKVTKIMQELEMSFGKRQIFCKSVASEKKLP